MLRTVILGLGALTLLACEAADPDDLGDEAADTTDGAEQATDEATTDDATTDEGATSESGGSGGSEGDVPDPDESAACAKVFIDPLPAGDDLRLHVKMAIEPIGDVHGGGWDIGNFVLENPDGVNCYDMDPDWPPEGPNAIDWSYYMEVYVTDGYQQVEGYFTRKCTPWEGCGKDMFLSLPDFSLPSDE